MLSVQLSIPDLKARVLALRELAQDPMPLLQSITSQVRPSFEGWMNDLLAAELSLHLCREPYERKGEARNHRNGYRSRKLTMKGLGTLELRIPRDREGSFRTGLVPERIQYDPQIEQDLQMLFLGGASTRTVERMSERLFGRKLSAGEVSQANKRLLEPVEQWRQRSLAGEKYLYLFLDGTNFAMRRGDEVVRQCVLVVIGVNEARERRVLALQAGDRESASAWKAVFQDLVRRGLDPSTLRLGVMDGLPGLEKTFRSAFRRAKVQRCQFHKAGNVLAKVRKKDQGSVKAAVHEIFYAGSRLAAKQALGKRPGRCVVDRCADSVLASSPWFCGIECV